MNDNLKEVTDDLALIGQQIKAGERVYDFVVPFAHKGNTSLESIDQALKSMRFGLSELGVKYMEQVEVRLCNVKEMDAIAFRVVVDRQCYDKPYKQ